MCASQQCCWGLSEQVVLVALDTERLLCINQGQPCFRMPLWPVEAMRQAVSVSLEVEVFD